MTPEEGAMWAAIASAIAAIATVVLAIATILLSPLGHRVWRLLRKRYPKNLIIRVTALMSRMEDVEESCSVWRHRSTMTLHMNGFGKRGEVFLVSQHPWAIMAITMAFEDHDWEIELSKLRARFNPKGTK